MKADVIQKSTFFNLVFFQKLFVIAIPIMLQNFINSFVNMLDTFMIGRLGEVEISAAGLGNQIFFLLNLFLFGIGSGAGVFASQFWGQKNYKGITQTVGMCLIAALIAGGFFTVVCLLYPAEVIGLYTTDTAVIAAGSKYLCITALSFFPFSYSFVLITMLRAIEQVKVAMVVTFIALVLNAVLNLVLIFGYAGFPQLGIAGAAWATVISRFIELVCIYSIIRKKEYRILGSFSELYKPSASFIRRYFLVSAPVIANEILWSLGITVHNKIFAGTGTANYAAFTIMNTAAQLNNVVCIGMGTGACVLIAKTIGESNHNTAHTYAKQIAVFSPLIAIVVSLMVLFPLSMLLPYVFNVSSEVAHIMNSLFIVLVCIYPLRAFNVNMVIGVFRAGGDTVFCLFYDVFFMWAAAIPLSFFIASKPEVPIFIVYVALLSEEIFKLPFGIIRLKTGKWLRSFTE